MIILLYIVSLAVISVVVYRLALLFNEKDKRDREFTQKNVDKIADTFEDTIGKVFEQISSTNEMFYEMVKDVEVKHFEQLTEQTEKLAKVFGDNVDKFVDIVKDDRLKTELAKIQRIERVDNPIKNEIEKEEEIINPLEDFDPANFRNIKNIQFDGEEEIYPISSE